MNDEELNQLEQRVTQIEDKQNKLIFRLSGKLKEYEQRIANLEYELRELKRK